MRRERVAPGQAGQRPGLEAVTRAYAKIVDQANLVDRNALRAPTSATGR